VIFFLGFLCLGKKDEKLRRKLPNFHQMPICVGQNFGMPTHYYLQEIKCYKTF